MKKEDKKGILGFIFLCVLVFIVYIVINQKMGANCIDKGGKAVYTIYGIYEKCIK